MIRDLTPNEETCLVEYCMKPENTWLALAIGQIQPVLRKEIEKKIAYFLEELDKSVKKKLEECGLHWETCVPKTNLEENESLIYKMSMNAQDIQIHLYYEDEKEKENNLFVGIPKNEAFKSADALRNFFKNEGLKDSEDEGNDRWPWWIYPEENHKSAVALITKHDDQRREKIEYFTNELVLPPAKAISKALEA